MACAAVCGVSTSLPSFIHGTSRVENAVPVISFLLMCAWLVRPEAAPPGDEMRFVSAPRFALGPYQMGDLAANLRQAPESASFRAGSRASDAAPTTRPSESLSSRPGK